MSQKTFSSIAKVFFVSGWLLYGYIVLQRNFLSGWPAPDAGGVLLKIAIGLIILASVFLMIISFSGRDPQSAEPKAADSELVQGRAKNMKRNGFRLLAVALVAFIAAMAINVATGSDFLDSSLGALLDYFIVFCFGLGGVFVFQAAMTSRSRKD